MAELRAASRPLARPAILFAALAVIVISLIALILGPALVQRDMDSLHDELDYAVDPASRAVEELRYYIAREMALARGFVLTGDSSSLANLFSMRDSAAALARRFPIEVRALSPAVAEDIGAAQAYVDTWHSQFLPSELRPLARPYPEDVFARAAHQTALAGLDSLRASLALSAADRRARIRESERLQIETTVVLGVLGLVSAALVTWLVLRVRRLAVEAEMQRAESRRLARVRDRLIRGVSHDLKNPLGVIDGYGELLEMGLRGPLTPEQAHTIQRIRSTVQSMLARVNELVDLSGAQTGLLHVERQPIAIATLLRELVADYVGPARTEGLELRLEPIPPLPPPYADWQRVRQVLENLVGNAIKYTARGGTVTLSAELTTGPGRGRSARQSVAIRVEDTGPGIPADRLEQIFEEFVRLENASGTSGSGVGLAMARAVARAMGGDVTVESQLGIGSAFTLWLPVARE